MKRNMSWDDVKLFLAVARAGGLADSAKATSISPATLGRRVTALENALEIRLFERGPRGYSLTEAGRDLLVLAEDMEAAGRSIETWQTNKTAVPRIRISAGAWTLQLLLSHADSIMAPDGAWLPDFLADHRRRDIARREVDIGIRSKRPEEPWLAGQRVGKVEFAVFAAKGATAEKTSGWIGLTGDESLTATARWISANHGSDVSITVNRSLFALPLVLQGKGRFLLPCFIGDAFASLERIGDPVKELQTEQWVVVHEAERHHQPLRGAIDTLSRFLKSAPLLGTTSWQGGMGQS